MFDGFVRRQVRVGVTALDVAMGGDGPPLLLLHGFPETKAAWCRVAPALASRFTVIAPDLPGYGDSPALPPAARHAHASKRAVAGVLVELMRELGFDRFGLAGHDRGGRVAYRLALDRPEHVRRLALLDVIPTLEMAERLTHEIALRMANWFFLAQPAPLPETLIGAAPEFYLDQVLDGWLGTPGAILPEARAEYARCFRESRVIAAACEDYRAGAGVDIEHDHVDRAHGQLIECPLLVLWGAKGLTAAFGDVLRVWRAWARDVRGCGLAAGHFLMEEAPAEVARELETFFGPAIGDG